MLAADGAARREGFAHQGVGRLVDHGRDRRAGARGGLVGVIVGLILAVPLWVLAGRPWLAAVLALLAWVWVTGALHLDGLSDVADGLGAAHRDPSRFLEVLKDPHTGAFGVVTLIVQLLLKLVLLAELVGTRWWIGIILVPAWARWGTLWWSRRLPPIAAAGMAERFSWRLSMRAVTGWAILLTVASVATPPLLVALLLVPVISAYWRRRLGGISGDCLGASVEVLETLLLLALVLAAHLVEHADGVGLLGLVSLLG